MTENERIAKVLGLQWYDLLDVEREGVHLWAWRDATGKACGETYWNHEGNREPLPDYLPDWPNDIAACFRDLVPWANAKGNAVEVAVQSETYSFSQIWPRVGEFFIGHADTPAAAICAAFLAAFEVQQ